MADAGPTATGLRSSADPPGHRGLLPGGARRPCRSWSPSCSAGVSVVDLHCGGGRWLIAVARRFPETRLLGVEFEPDSVDRARRQRRRGRARGPDRDRGPRSPASTAASAPTTSPTSSTPSTSCADPVAGARGRLERRPAGRPPARARLVRCRRTSRTTGPHHGPCSSRDPARRALPGHPAADHRGVPRDVRGGRPARADRRRPAVGRDPPRSVRRGTPRPPRSVGDLDGRRRHRGVDVAVVR